MNDIPPLKQDVMQDARAHQARLAKPQGALGMLEALSIRLAGMTGRMDWMPNNRTLALFGADHGVMAHDVSTVPQAITAYMMGQFMAGKAAINVLTRQMHTHLIVVDAGVNAELPFQSTDAAEFIPAKIAYGTQDFTLSPAMTAEQASQALNLGASVAANHDMDILLLGEMGIGNTTSASAIIAAITGVSPAIVTGRGTGVDDTTLQRKIHAIETALSLSDAADVLAKVGGFEIGAMAGAMLYAASQRIPVILDGLICTSAALIAYQHNPDVVNYLIAGHQSAEPGHHIALEYLGLEPLLRLDMRLGEGSGAVLALPLIEAAMRTLNEMGTL